MVRRSVVDIGMEILRAEGALAEPVVTTIQQPEEPVEDDNPVPAAVLAEVTDRLTALADQLAIRQTLDTLAMQVNKLSDLVMTLQIYVTQPRIKVPVRDEAGRITEVRELIEPQRPLDAD